MRSRQPLSNLLDAARGSSLAQVKAQQLAREDEERLRLRRVCGVLVLVEQFLLEQGYVQALHALQQESGVSLSTYRVADNVDLLSVVDEFEHYYEYKHKRKPALFRVRAGSEAAGDDNGDGSGGGGSGGERTRLRRRRVPSTALTPTPPSVHTGADNNNNNNGGSSTSPVSARTPNYATAAGHGGSSSAAATSPTAERARAAVVLPPPSTTAATTGVANTTSTATALSSQLRRTPAHLARALNSNSNNSKATTPASPPQLSIDAQRIGAVVPALRVADVCAVGDAATTTSGGDGVDDVRGVVRGRALRPLPHFATSELADLASTILREIVDVDPAVHWHDVAELDSAKHLLQEAVVMPVRYPALFEGVVRPWKGILLFGPPGTGKTMLAKAVATECRTTFFNIAASSVVSKWRGDSEKLVRMLFDLAVHYAPSTIFIDEIDSLMSARSSDGEHEGSRRMKTELLTQMDGLSKRRGGEVVFVMAASNVPWDLDTAMLRRLEKRVHVGLPTATARAAMFRRLLGHRVDAHAAFDWDACASRTTGLSGADIDIICREATMRPIRKLIAQLETMRHHGGNNKVVDGSAGAAAAATRATVPCVTLDDVYASIACTRSSVQQADLPKYERWAEKYASGLST